MNNLTYLPKPEFMASAELLSLSHLAASRTASVHLLRNFVAGRKPRARPGLLWAGHEAALAALGLYYAAEVGHRQGRSDPLMEELRERWISFRKPKRMIVMPEWFGDDRLHSSHRRLLLKEDRVFYRKIFPGEKPSANLWWPHGK